MKQTLRVLIAEDNPADAELVVRELNRAGFELDWKRVDTETDYQANLKDDLDVILSDYDMPQFGGVRALEILRESTLDVPFIIISGTIGEDVAVEAMRHGAEDYFLKDRLARLGASVRQALEKNRLRRERRRAEEALLENAAFIEDVLNSLTAGVVVVDEGGEITIANDVWKRFAQENGGGDPVGQNYLEVCARSVEKFDNADAIAAAQGIRNVLAGTAADFSMEYPCHSPTQQRWFQMRISPLRGRQGGVVVAHERITERKIAEARIREQAELLDLAHDAIIVRGFADRRVSFWNKGAENLYGWSAGEAVGRRIHELIYADAETMPLIETNLRERGEWRGENRHVRKDGKQMVVSTRATLVREPGGEPKSVLLINTDVTEQKNLETRLLRAQRMESIGTLAGGVAHDLNNILAPIMMSVPMLRLPLSETQREGIISTIEMSAERGAQIVRQVLTFGRGLEGERIPLDLGGLIAEVLQIAGQTFPKGIAVESIIAPELWPVTGDTTQLHQVLLNLSINARDAMPHGGKLRLSARNFTVDESYSSMVPEAAPGRYVLVEVSDNGTGIAPEILERIFDPFFTTKGVGRGTGLGLSTVIGIVRSHGGLIHVASQPGQGATFQIYLPASADGEAIAEPPAGIAPPRGDGECILVVDDEITVGNSARMALESFGYRVLLAGDGTEALALFAQKPNGIHAVLTDIAMPFMDGIALIRALRKMQPGLRIIASTGLAEKSELASLKSLGVEIILHKPYGADTLLRTVHETLHPESSPTRAARHPSS
jgi:PAS domain S-box-containing protein